MNQRIKVGERVMARYTITDNGADDGPVVAREGDIGVIVGVVDDEAFVYDVDWPGGGSVTDAMEFRRITAKA